MPRSLTSIPSAHPPPPTAARKAYQSVLVFVDWNSQIHSCSSTNSNSDPVDIAKATFQAVTRRIAKCLSAIDQEGQFRATLRLYHGWHKGFQPSINKKAISAVIGRTDFATLSHRPNVVFSPDVGFGDRLITALPARLHVRLSIHLPNTLRDQGEGRTEEKMVDTALATDILLATMHDPENWILVAAEDDDVVPPLFAAEAILRPHNSRVLLISHRKRSQTFLNLDQIYLEGA